MKPLLCSLQLLFALSLPAQAPEPARLPGEPHHHLKIDNSFIRAYYVEVAAHADTQLHQHDYDYIFITLGATDIINAVRDKPEVHLVLKDGEVHFSRGGFAHVARNLSDAPFRNVTIELLKPQGEARNLCAEIVPGSAARPCGKVPAEKRTAYYVEPQFETAEIAVDLVQLAPNAGKVGIIAQTGSLLVPLNESEVQIAVEGKPAKTMRGGEVIWLEAGSHETLSNPSKKTASYLQLSFKDSFTKPG